MNVLNPTHPTVSRSLFNQHKYLRFLSNLKSRLRSLQFQYSFQKSSGFVSRQSFDLYEFHVDILNHLIQSFSSILLVNNYFVCNSAEDKYRELYSYWRSLPRTLESHCIFIFGFYHKPVLKEISDLNYLYKLKLKSIRSPGSFNIDNLDSRILKAEHALELIQNFKEKLKISSQQARTDYLKKRLLYEANYRISNGWFPFLATLTVNDYNYDKVFSSDSSVWTDYIRKFDRDVGISAFGSWRNALNERKNGNEFHTYFAVVERGSQTGRLHIHVLHFINHLPSFIVDPNLGATKPINRQITYFRSIWQYGFADVRSVRTGPFDCFAKKGWRMPCISLKHGVYQPISSKPISATVQYVAKYITKQNSDNLQKEGVKWRTRMTRNLGIKILQLALMKVKSHHRRKILRAQKIPLQLLNLQIPKKLLQNIVTKLHLMEMSKMTPKNFFRHLSVLSRLPLKENIFKSFRDVINASPTHNQVNSGTIETPSLNDSDISEIQNIIDDVSYNYFTNINFYSFNGSTSDYLGV